VIEIYLTSGLAPATFGRVIRGTPVSNVAWTKTGHEPSGENQAAH